MKLNTGIEWDELSKFWDKDSCYILNGYFLFYCEGLVKINFEDKYFMINF